MKTLKIILIVISSSAFTHNLSFCQDIKAGKMQLLNVSGYTFKVKIQVSYEIGTYNNRSFILVNWGDNSDLDSLHNGIGFGGCGDTNTLSKNFEGTHTYLSPGNFNITCVDSFRVSGISNINNSETEKIYLLYNLVINPFLGVNSSPSIISCAVDKWNCCNYIYNPSAYDPDGDSLAYSIVPLYTTNYSFPQYTINNITGDLNIYPSTIGKYSLCMKIDEWRKIGTTDYLIGSTYQDMLIEVNSLSFIENNFNNNKVFEIFPNPTQTYLILNWSKPEFQNFHDETTFKIINKFGSEVKNGKVNSFPHTVSLEGFNEGLYVIVLQNEKLYEKAKFVKLEE